MTAMETPAGLLHDGYPRQGRAVISLAWDPRRRWTDVEYCGGRTARQASPTGVEVVRLVA